jgi:hypothetical protein
MTFDFSQLFSRTRKKQELLFKFSFSISILNCFNYHFAMRVRQHELGKGEKSFFVEKEKARAG